MAFEGAAMIEPPPRSEVANDHDRWIRERYSHDGTASWQMMRWTEWGHRWTWEQLVAAEVRVTHWMGPISQCPDRHADVWACDALYCTGRCGTPDGCVDHVHCRMCDAVKCHDLWWRSRRRPL